MNSGDHEKESVSRSLAPSALGVLLVIAGLLAYSNSFQGNFTLDDNGTIIANPYVQHLWPLASAMKAPVLTTTSGRPIACLINALNYAASGYDYAGWRAGNLLVHLLCALLLFGTVRRTLAHSAAAVLLKARATAVAFASALIFVVHPLQTEAVNYIAQRTEAVMAFFYLLTFYCAIRGWQSGRRAWFFGAVAACALGMGSKEVMVSAPIMLLLYDRIFNADSFRQVLRRSWLFYAALIATWLVLGHLLLIGGTSNGAQWGRLKHTGYEYLLTQGDVIVYYLRLTVWPSPLCFDYGWPFVHSLGEAWVGLLAVVILLAATVYALVRHPAVGFLGIACFAILAPSSSILPLPDAAVEYRMYLPLALLAVLYVCAAVWLIDAAAARWCAENTRPQRVRIASCAALAALAAVFASMTYVRNLDYRSPVELWTDVVRKRPLNPRGHINCGVELVNEVTREMAATGQPPAPKALEKLAVAANEMAMGLKIDPDARDAHINLGSALAMLGRNREALNQLQLAVQESPGNPRAHFNLANLLSTLGQKAAALQEYARAVELDPDFTDAHYNFGVDLYDGAKYPEAQRQFGEVLRLDSRSSVGHYMLGLTLLKSGQRGDAEAELKAALALNPNFEQARMELQKLQH